MKACERSFPTASKYDLMIFKLLHYVNLIMNMDSDLMATHPEAREAVGRGLAPRQIQYVFKSYRPIDARKHEFAFLDEVRDTFIKEGIIDRTILEKPEGWLIKQKLDRHLKKLVELQVLTHNEGQQRYKLNAVFWDHTLPYHYKKMLRATPANWMTSGYWRGETALVYGRPKAKLYRTKISKLEGVKNLKDKEIESTRTAFETTLLEMCEDFDKEVLVLHATYMYPHLTLVEVEKMLESMLEAERKDFWASIPTIVTSPASTIKFLSKDRAVSSGDLRRRQPRTIHMFDAKTGLPKLKKRQPD
jgi:hypothetical protein